MQWYVYVLLCADFSFYCGITTNVERRLKQHNGKIKGGAKYTRSKRPCKYLYFEECFNRSDASKKEFKFKNLTKSKKIKVLNYVIKTMSQEHY